MHDPKGVAWRQPSAPATSHHASLNRSFVPLKSERHVRCAPPQPVSGTRRLSGPNDPWRRGRCRWPAQNTSTQPFDGVVAGAHCAVCSFIGDENRHCVLAQTERERNRLRSDQFPVDGCAPRSARAHRAALRIEGMQASRPFVGSEQQGRHDRPQLPPPSCGNRVDVQEAIVDPRVGPRGKPATVVTVACRTTPLKRGRPDTSISARKGLQERTAWSSDTA